jgi:hypothetical protein
VSLDSKNWANLMAKEAGDVVSTAIDAKKTAEAIAINSGNNIGGTGLSGAAYVASRGGLNAQGYYNDVPVHQQLTANERASVTLSSGNINTGAMLAILNQKEAEYRRSQGLVDFSPGSSTTSSGYLVATPPAPTIMSTIVSEPTPPVKTAPIDTILFDEAAVPIDIMSDLIFENIGGQELISIVRSDIVNGQKISYQPIKNLSSIQQQYNPNNILGLQQTANRFFAGFSIKLEDKIPEVGNGLNGENVYFDESTGDLIIEFVNLSNDEQIETQITVNGTIYEANLGDYTS